STTQGKVTYQAICPELSCSDSVTIQVRPCQFKIQGPDTLVKIAEPVSLTASGCPGGTVRWSTGDMGDTVLVRPLDKTTYTADCIIGETSACSASVTVDVDRQAPEAIECPDFSLLAPKEVVQCEETFITPAGCPATAT